MTFKNRLYHSKTDHENGLLIYRALNGFEYCLCADKIKSNKEFTFHAYVDNEVNILLFINDYDLEVPHGNTQLDHEARKWLYRRTAFELSKDKGNKPTTELCNAIKNSLHEIEDIRITEVDSEVITTAVGKTPLSTYKVEAYDEMGLLKDTRYVGIY